MNVPFDSSIHPQPSQNPRPERIQQVPSILRDLEQAAAEKPSHPVRDARVLARDLARQRVEPLADRVPHDVQADVVGERHHGREAVGEFQDRGGRDDGDEAEVVWDAGRDDVADDPPDGDDDDPEDFAGFGLRRDGW